MYLGFGSAKKKLVQGKQADEKKWECTVIPGPAVPYHVNVSERQMSRKGH